MLLHYTRTPTLTWQSNTSCSVVFCFVFGGGVGGDKKLVYSRQIYHCIASYGQFIQQIKRTSQWNFFVVNYSTYMDF